MTNYKKTADVYVEFPKILIAFHFRDQNAKVQAHQKDTEETGQFMLPLFAYDIPSHNVSSGSKRFIVSSYKLLMNKLFDLKSERRNFYEIILADTPCFLYIDVEYYLKTNPLEKFAELEIKFLEKICIELGKYSQVKPTIVITESSTPAAEKKKISRHYILRGAAFKNNYHCGAFMRRFCATYKDEFTVQSSKNESEFFADLTVYTMNRNFRTLYSSKLGDHRPLMIASLYGGATAFPCNTELYDIYEVGTLSEKEVFLHSLIQNVDLEPDAGLVECMERDGTSPVSSSKKGEFSKIPTQISYYWTTREFMSHQGDSFDWIPNDFRRMLFTFIERDYPTSKHKNLAIKRYYRESMTIFIETRIGECRLLGGSHAHNHIFFVCDLFSDKYFQACHSDRCRGKRKTYKSLSKELCEKTILLRRYGANNIREWICQQESSPRKSEQFRSLIDAVRNGNK